MFKKEVKVKDKWVVDNFKLLSDEERGLTLLTRVVAREMALLVKQEGDLWEELGKKYGLDPHYHHSYNSKTKTIKELFRKVATK